MVEIQSELGGNRLGGRASTFSDVSCPTVQGILEANLPDVLGRTSQDEDLNFAVEQKLLLAICRAQLGSPLKKISMFDRVTTAWGVK